MSTNFKTILSEVKFFLKDKFDLIDDKENDLITINEIKKTIEFKGTNLWILIFAIIIASVGLNMNSAAVIIGAMLISPLMGPIIGVGLGAGINDFELIKKSLRNLALAGSISILTSALYFWITPLGDASSELLARTKPTLWDVLIALAGGLAGVIAASRKEKTNAIPGVAIATALMPPLCTSGYGLATGNWSYFLGALYLFFINCVFISLSTLFIVRFLKYPKKEFVDARIEKKVKTYISISVLLFIIPSILLAFNFVKNSVLEKNANQFISNEFNFDETNVINKKLILNSDQKKLILFLYGSPVEQDVIDHSSSKLASYGLDDFELVVKQNDQKKEGVDIATIEKMNLNMRSKFIEDLYEKNDKIIADKEQKIKVLEEEVIRLKSNQVLTHDISQELKALHPNVHEFTISKTILEDLMEDSYDTLTIAAIHFHKRPSSTEKKKLESWLKIRSKADSLKLILY